METSLFNVFIKYNKTIIGYNTLYDTFLLLDENLYSLIDEKFKKGKIEEINNMHSQLYQTLIKNKFIISNQKEELKEVKNILDKTNTDDSIFEITINPTINCNFKCWYCYEDHNIKSKIDELERENIIDFIRNIISENKNLKTLKIYWFGGEPLLHYKDIIKPIMSEVKYLTSINNIDFLSGITSNGYLINEEFLDFLKQHYVKNFQITLDGNKARHNNVRFTQKGVNTYDRILKNIISCLNKEFYVSVRINISAETDLDVKELLQDFSNLSSQEKHYLCFSIHKVWQAPSHVEKLIEVIVNQIRENGFNCATYYSSPNSIKNTCYADKVNHLVINPNGNIFKCTARDFNVENIEGHLLKGGIIEWNALHQRREKTTVFNYKECLSCAILPICNAGCSQKKMENPDNICPYGYKEEAKNEYAKKVLFDKIEQGHIL
jgi:uncharacterized protein